jgi:hypothetical protein
MLETLALPLVTAVLGSGLTALWLQRRYKREDELRARRRERLAEWRQGLDQWEREHPEARGDGATGPRFRATLRVDGLPSESITYCAWYLSLEPYLTIDVDPWTAPVGALRREVDRIEREDWRLV